MSAAIASAVREVLEFHRAEPWDSTPTIGYVYREPLDASTSAIVAKQIPIPSAVWDAAPPAIVLRSLREALGEMRATVAFDLLAMIMTTEGWALEHATTQERAWARTHAIADHPRGRETKDVWAVDVEGHRYVGSYWRGDKEPRFQESSGAFGTPLTGAMLDELALIPESTGVVR